MGLPEISGFNVSAPQRAYLPNREARRASLSAIDQLMLNEALLTGQVQISHPL